MKEERKRIKRKTVKKSYIQHYIINFNYKEMRNVPNEALFNKEYKR